MRRYTIRILLVLALCTMLVAAACEKTTIPTDIDLFDIEKVRLNPEEKQFVLDSAKALVRGEKPKADDNRFPVLNNPEPSGVFISISRPSHRALTGFGVAYSIQKALANAAADLTPRTKGMDFSKSRVRVDIINDVGSLKERRLNKKYRPDTTLKGIIFDTKPRAAFLGQELRDYGVFSKVAKRRRYQAKQMSALIRSRKLDSALHDQLDKGSDVRAAYFKTISIIEATDGKYLDLYRGNLLEGFESTPERLTEAINAAGDYLKLAVKSDGEFEYRYHPETDSLADAYNLLRHGGTTFAMGQIYEINKDPELLESIKRALGYLERVSMGPDANDSKTYDWKAVANQEHLYAKLGGSGLALLAFGTYTTATGDMQYLPLMKSYGRFIEYMQEENGHMQQRYWHRPEDKGRQTKPVLYYPGEAFFGLGKLYEITKNPRWMKVVDKGVDYIANIRDADTVTNKLQHDHWLMYAINEMNKFKVKDNHTKHARRVMDAMMGKFIYESKYPDFVGGFYKKPKATSVSCRMEGMAAQYQMAVRMGDQEWADTIYEALKKGGMFLMRNQYNETNTIFFPNPNKTIGCYMASFWEQNCQIDTTQHSTSALVSIRKIMLERRSTMGEKSSEAMELKEAS